MGLKPGYKITEVGLIPSDWKVFSLGEVFEISGGYPASRDQLSSNGYCYLHYGDIHKSTRTFIDTRNDYIEIPKLDISLNRISSKSMLGDGDVVFVDASEDDEGTSKHIVVKNPDNIPFISGLHTIVAKSKTSLFDDIYKRYCFQTRDIKRQFYTYAVGIKVSGVSKTNIKKILIPCPPLPEQRAIADALSDMDALITSLDKLIAKKRLIKQAAMQELLHPKNGWPEKRLGNTAILKARIGWQGLTTAEYLTIGDYYLVTGTDFKDGFIDWDTCHYVDASRYKQDVNIQLRENDVLVTKDGTIGKVAFIDHLEKPATLNSGVFVIRPIEDSFDPRFFYYILLSNVFVDFLNQLSAGSTINHLYQKDFVNFIYRIPSTIAEQTRIAEILRDMDAEISTLEQRRDKTSLLKQGMMQELLTGKTRLI